MNNSIILNTDSYKVSMWKQYPPQTNTIYSYIESRGGMYDQVVYFGLQAFIKEYLLEPVTLEQVQQAEEIWTAHGLPFNRAGWEYIVNELGGRLPLKIRTLPEGIRVPVGVPLATIQNTDPECFWLTTWIETAMLRAVWYPTTVASVSADIREFLREALESTGDVSGLDFKLHDFGARGATSLEAAGIGGAAHLLSFSGTDTMSGIMFLRKYYGADMPGFSIPATEHSTITSWGKYNEADAYENMLDQYGQPGAIFACVSDSYDIFNAADNIWGDQLRQKVIDSGSTVVIRPDSGDPETVVYRLIEILAGRFGYTVNSKGYRVLNNVRIIQGDGVNPDSIRAIVKMLISNQWSIDNIAFGMGGALLQKVDRDTQKFAMKCSAIDIGGSWFDVRKQPVTDPGKDSKAGRVTAVLVDGELQAGVVDTGEDAMYTVYENGELLVDEGFDVIRERAQA